MAGQIGIRRSISKELSYLRVFRSHEKLKLNNKQVSYLKSVEKSKFSGIMKTEDRFYVMQLFYLNIFAWNWKFISFNYLGRKTIQVLLLLF